MEGGRGELTGLLPAFSRPSYDLLRLGIDVVYSNWTEPDAEAVPGEDVHELPAVKYFW